jgi:AcrR family transcriptional regulator
MGRYRLKRRAERQQETRGRIVRAAVDLHCALGPARTTILAIAERAGVERPTVYRHFPTLDALFRACSARHWSESPPPDPEPWARIEDPAARLRRGLGELYAHYTRHESALWNILRDLEDDPRLRKFGARHLAHRARARDVLAEAWRPHPRNRRALLAAVGHAVDFFAWRSLRRQGLGDAEAVERMLDLVRSAAAG